LKKTIGSCIHYGVCKIKNLIFISKVEQDEALNGTLARPYCI